LFCSSIAPSNSGANKTPPIVAVFDIEVSHSSQVGIARKLTQILRVELAATKKLIIVDKGEQEAQLRILLRAQKEASYSACVDDSCQIPLGKELAANQILRTQLTKFGKKKLITSELVDVATGGSAGGASIETDGTPDDLLRGIKLIAHRLTGTGPLEGGSGETVILGVASAARVSVTGGKTGRADGIVQFETIPPGARVSVEGRRLAGITPFEDFVPLGEKLVRVDASPSRLMRFESYEEKMELRAGMKVVVRLKEITGEVVVVVRDTKGALLRNVPVFLDGKAVAKSPVRLKGISLGPHTIQAEDETGKKARRSFHVKFPTPRRITLVIGGAESIKVLCDRSDVRCENKAIFATLQEDGPKNCKDSTMFGFSDWKSASMGKLKNYCYEVLRGKKRALDHRKQYKKCMRATKLCFRVLGETEKPVRRKVFR